MEKTIVQQLEAATAEMQAQATKITGLEDQVKALTVERDAAVAEAAEHKQTLTDTVADMAAKADEAAKELTAAKDAHAATQTELEKAQKVLERPEFADALARGEATETEEGGTPADAASEPTTKDEALAQYKTIKDPHARAEYRATHKELLGL